MWERQWHQLAYVQIYIYIYIYRVKMYSFYLLYKRWLGWISLGHAFIHKIDNDIEKFWWIAVQLGYHLTFIEKFLIYFTFLFFQKSLALNVHKMGSQGKDVIHLLLYQLCMISKHDFHMEYYSTCPSQFQ